MKDRSLETFCGILLVLRGCVQAQITLAPIPTSACAGQGLSGSATFASSTSLATGAQRIPAGDFWNQVGAEWVFDTDTSGIQFSDLAAENGPDTSEQDAKAVSLDDSKTKWTLSLASGVSEYSSRLLLTILVSPLAKTTLAEIDIVFNALPTSAANASGAKFRRDANFRRAPASFDFIITASVPCSDDPGQPQPTPTNSENSGNPSQASLCSNAAIETTDTNEWVAYGVSCLKTPQ